MKTTSLARLLVLLAGLWGLSAYAQNTYSVSTVAEINALLGTLQPGDVVVMSDGTWTNAQLQFAGTGTEEAPIVLTVQTPGGVSLEGNSSLEMNGRHLIVDGLVFQNGFTTKSSVVSFRRNGRECRSCRLTNTTIDNFSHPDSSRNDKWISLYGVQNRVDHCRLINKTNLGSTLVVWMDDVPDYHRIDHNHFDQRPKINDITNGLESIRVGTSTWSGLASSCTIEYNLFEECDGEIEIISNKSNDNTYRYNTFLNSSGALTLRVGNRCWIYGNYFLNTANKSQTGGIRVTGRDHYIFSNYFYQLDHGGSDLRAAISIQNANENPSPTDYYAARNCFIGFNTFFNCRRSLVFGSGAQPARPIAPEGMELVGNIIYDDFWFTPLIRYVDSPTTVTYTQNIVFGEALGIDSVPGLDPLDPQFIPIPEVPAYFRPSNPSLSDVYDATGLPIQYDLQGQLRNLSAMDLGADELKAGIEESLPLASTGPVGPYTEGYWLEIECGSVGANWVEVPSAEASGELALSYQGPSNTLTPPTDSAAWVSHALRLEKAGRYHLSMR
ncbi:MAG: polysaccharide lyase 6 family protein, partial [Bacteroidota bacterium]